MNMVITGHDSSLFALQVAERSARTSTVYRGITAIFAISGPDVSISFNLEQISISKGVSEKS
jgi:hypothetical protein